MSRALQIAEVHGQVLRLGKELAHYTSAALFSVPSRQGIRVPIGLVGLGGEEKIAENGFLKIPEEHFATRVKTPVQRCLH